MLPIPTKGFAKSVESHNIHQDKLCDWIEASLLFDPYTDYVSQMDVVDVLLTEERYISQDFAFEGVKSAWGEIERRLRCSKGAVPLKIERSRIRRNTAWIDSPEYSFCLVLSLIPVYDWWTESGYSEQGELFEILTLASIQTQFSDWQVWRTGWSRTTPVRLRDVAVQIVELLNEPLGDVDTWKDNKEMGLDLLLFRPFQDDRNGIPVVMVQCASGRNWNEKLGTPNLRKWRDVIRFRNHLAKAFSMPFCLDRDEFVRTCVEVDGIVFDRYRLLSAGSINPRWVPEMLREPLLTWLEPRVNQLLLRASL